MKYGRRNALLTVIALILCTALFTASAESAIVTASAMRVYKNVGLSSYKGKIAKNVVVNVKSYSGGVAKITYKGKTGYVNADDMALISNVSKPAVTTTATRFYKKPSLKAKFAKLKKGVEVNVLSVTGTCARVERNGAIGYMYTGHISYRTADAEKNDSDSGSSQEAAEKPEEKKEENTSVPQTVEDVFASGKYSNDMLVYMFCTKIMGLNSAAACGIMANIKYESGYKPTSGGDSGTSYGICQWHAGRKTRLINWCENNGYSYDTLLGQLYFLQYELQKYYPSVWKYLNNVENSAEGSYDAAYYFCFNFEAPANKATKSTTRGAYAQTTVYTKYVTV